jgi:folate-binding Fe-S cluster repair protein YgfZ
MTASEPTHVKLPNRGVLSVAGAEAESFLQNLVSNNVAPALPASRATTAQSALTSASSTFARSL